MAGCQGDRELHNPSTFIILFMGHKAVNKEIVIGYCHT